eukprot:362200-Chlamydomonas_euryale.AAC.3
MAAESDDSTAALGRARFSASRPRKRTLCLLVFAALLGAVALKPRGTASRPASPDHRARSYKGEALVGVRANAAVMAPPRDPYVPSEERLDDWRARDNSAPPQVDRWHTNTTLLRDLTNN